MVTEVYETEELILGATLISQGIKYQGLRKQKTTDQFLIFIFDWDDRIPRIELTYYAGSLRVDPLAYTSALRRLKAEIRKWRAEHNVQI